MMRKRNHRKPYQIDEIEKLRVRVAIAYKNCSGEDFLKKGYRDSYSYKALVSKIEEHGCGTISNSTLHKFFIDGDGITNNSIPFQESTVTKLKCFAEKFEHNGKQETTTDAKDESAITETAIHLQHLYEEDEILKGVEKANQAYSKYGAHPKILRHFFRFNMRLNRWQKISTEAAKILECSSNDKVFTLCKLAMCEWKLRDAYSNINPQNKEHQLTQINSAQRDLDSVPETQHDNKEYWYWQGRWYMEWWYYNGGINISDLKLALSHFKESLKLKDSWFCDCYKCIILKLLENNTFKAEVKSFTKKIIDEKERQPNRPAVRTYRITSFVLNDDMPGLIGFLKKNNLPSSATDFQSTIFHHIELIYFKSKKMQEKYKTVLENWVANLPVK